MGLIFLIIGIAWLAQYLSKLNLEEQIRQAQGSGNTSELQRLNRIRCEKEQISRQFQKENAANQQYFDAIMVLDAAEHGVFVPNPEDYFNHLGEDQIDRRGVYEYELDPADDYEDNSWDEYDDDRGGEYEYPEDY